MTAAAKRRRSSISCMLPAVQNAEAYAEKKALFDKVWTVLMCRREGERLDTKTAVTRHESMKRRL